MIKRTQMRQREPRRKVLIKARMRLNGAWGDVRIQNISSRGLLIQAPHAPEHGTYLEIYRVRYVIVARVAWADGRNFGVQTQDRLDVDGIISEPDTSGLRFTTTGTEQVLERRLKPRGPSKAQLERQRERSMKWAYVPPFRAPLFHCVPLQLMRHPFMEI